LDVLFFKIARILFHQPETIMKRLIYQRKVSTNPSQAQSNDYRYVFLIDVLLVAPPPPLQF